MPYEPLNFFAFICYHTYESTDSDFLVMILKNTTINVNMEQCKKFLVTCYDKEEAFSV